MSLTDTRSLARVGRSGSAALIVLFSVVTGCAAQADEGPGGQYPTGPIGVPGTPAVAPPSADGEVVIGAPGASYGQPGQAEDGVADDGAADGDEYADTDPSALTDFQSALDPYGQWVQDPNYGTVWQPYSAVVGSDFVPYETNGYWSYDDSYVWVSGYSWGWAPFHYGRWVYASNGWGWIPGRTYAGAWTTWRVGYGAYSGYVGWAPLPPTWYWRGGVAVGVGVVPPAAFGFCRAGALFSPSLTGQMLSGPQVGTIGQNSQPVARGGVSTGGRGGYGTGSAPGRSGGRTLASPSVAGPSPSSLHIAGTRVTRPPASNPGLARAQQFARPSSAVALGARAPIASPLVSRSAAPRIPGAGVNRPSRPVSAPRSAGAYGAYNGGFHGQTRILGANQVYGPSHIYAPSSSSYNAGGHQYASPYYGGAHYGGLAMPHVPGHPGAAPAPQAPPPSYGEGYVPGRGSSGHFGGGHGGGGHAGGGHR
jgi:hypothetical protein